MFLGCRFDKDKTQMLKLLFTDKNCLALYDLCRDNVNKEDTTVFKNWSMGYCIIAIFVLEAVSFSSVSNQQIYNITDLKLITAVY